MAEHDFEMALDRMFAEAPAFADADLFALKVDQRLNRGWTFRRMLIGGLGLAGGLIGGGQLLGSNLFGNLSMVSDNASRLINQSVAQALPEGLHTGGFGITGQVIWMSVAMAAVALGLAVTRLVREI